MENILFKKLSGVYVCLLLCLLVSTSCSDNVTPTLVNPQELCNDAYKSLVVLNGEQLSSQHCIFSAVEGDKTKLNLLMRNVIPYQQDIAMLVDVFPDETGVRFSGSTDNANYHIELTGAYEPTTRSGGANETAVSVDVKYAYKAIPNILQGTYTFRFDKNNFYVWNCKHGSFDWDGQSWSYAQLAESALTHISERIARETTAMRVSFNEDASMDISLQRAGSAEFSSWMKLHFWHRDKEGSNLVYLQFTYNQMETFMKEWFGGLPRGLYSPFGLDDMGNWLLPMVYQIDNGRLCWSLAKPNLQNAITIYTSDGKGVAGLTKKELEEMRFFAAVLPREDDMMAEMYEQKKLYITINSEPLE